MNSHGTARIGACDDQRVGILPGSHGRTDLAHRNVTRLDNLVVHVTTALGPGLVFELNRRDSKQLHAPHRADHIGNIPVAGVAIDNQREVGHAAHGMYRIFDFGISAQADVWLAVACGGGGIAADIGGFKPGLFDQTEFER